MCETALHRKIIRFDKSTMSKLSDCTQANYKREKGQFVKLTLELGMLIICVVLLMVLVASQYMYKM